MMKFNSNITRRIDEVSFSLLEEYATAFSRAPSEIFRISTRDKDSYYNDDDDEFNTQKITLEDVTKQLKTLTTSLKEIMGDPMSHRHVCNATIKLQEACYVYNTGIIVHMSVVEHEKQIHSAINIAAGLVTKDAFDKLTDWAQRVCPVAADKKDDEINIIADSGNGGYYLLSIKLTEKINTFSYDNYNEDFEPVSKRILDDICKPNDSGLVLLHGDMGTGKTSYLKYLLRAVKTKKIIYVPPDLISALSSPNFITFLMNNAMNSILLIEDAENVLKHREAGGSQAVSNILNISNGILGDVLRMQLICTFNCDLNQIDPALLRPGRLIAEYDFKKLTADRTAALMKKLYGDDVQYDHREMSLAEVYNFNSMPHKTKQPEKVTFGFN